MSKSRMALIGSGIFSASTFAIHRHMSNRRQQQIQDTTVPEESKKFGTYHIVEAWLTGFIGGNDSLRKKGFTPQNLYHSANNSLTDSKRYRANIQLDTMLRFHPQQDESAIYEKSGELLIKSGSDKKGFSHLRYAFDAGHRPSYTMALQLGQHELSVGNIIDAKQVFTHLVDVLPSDDPNRALACNELGVTHLMSFCADPGYSRMQLWHLKVAFQLFRRASELNPNDLVSPLNFGATTSLAGGDHICIEPVVVDYGSPELFLKPQSGKPTSVIDAIPAGLNSSLLQGNSIFRGNDISVTWRIQRQINNFNQLKSMNKKAKIAWDITRRMHYLSIYRDNPAPKMKDTDLDYNRPPVKRLNLK